MFCVVIFLSAITQSILAESNTTYHEPAVVNVSLHVINGTSIGVPLFFLKTNLKTGYPMCFPNATTQEIVLFSLGICKILGHEALQRFYPADTSIIPFKNPGKGVVFSPTCNYHELLQGICEWHFLGKDICTKYLGVECTGCKYSINITDEKKQEIMFPPYIWCSKGIICEWKLTNINPKYKVTVLEFKNMFLERPLESSDNNDDSGHIIEVRWFDLKANDWTAVRTTINKLNTVNPIRVMASDITIHYSSNDCSLDETKRTRRNAAYLQYYTEEPNFLRPEGSIPTMILYILVSVLLLAVVLSIVSCTCCYLRRKNGTAYDRHTTTYTMSYIPGMNLSYEDDLDGNMAVSNKPQGNSQRAAGVLETPTHHGQGEVSNGSCSDHPPLTPSSSLDKSCQSFNSCDKKSLLSSIKENILSCMVRKSDSLPIPEYLLPNNAISDEVDDLSMVQYRFTKFDTLVLSFLSDSAESDKTPENSLLNLDFCSGQLVPTHKTEEDQLRSLVSQLATRYKDLPSRRDSRIEEDMFSCASLESLQSYHSIYQSRRTSRGSSIISTASDTQTMYSVEMNTDPSPNEKK